MVATVVVIWPVDLVAREVPTVGSIGRCSATVVASEVADMEVVSEVAEEAREVAKVRASSVVCMDTSLGTALSR